MATEVMQPIAALREQRVAGAGPDERLEEPVGPGSAWVSTGFMKYGSSRR